MNLLCILIGLGSVSGQIPDADTSTVVAPEVAPALIRKFGEFKKPEVQGIPRPSAGKAIVSKPAPVPTKPTNPSEKRTVTKSQKKKPSQRVREKKHRRQPAREPVKISPTNKIKPITKVPDLAVRPSAGELFSSDRLSEITRLAWLLFLGLVLFVVNRVIVRAIRIAAKTEKPWALIGERIWPLLELGMWISLAIWSVAYFWGTQNNFVLYALIGLVVLVVATQWNVLRDIAAGLVFAAERPFEIGEIVRIGKAEGQLRRLRLRHLELETEEGRLSQIPYRVAIGTTDVRTGSSSVAHSVQLDLDIPLAVDPKQALEAVREMAASSPWAVIGLRPRVDLQANTSGSSIIRVEAFAFDRDVKAALHTDMLSAWKEIVKNLLETSPRKI